MKRNRLSFTLLAVLLGAFEWPAATRADGIVVGYETKLTPVTEKEQQAFIEWADGEEHLYVATRTEPSAGPSLWLLPVPAPPEQVKAEPIQAFPHVGAARSVMEAAREQIDTIESSTLIVGLGSLLLCSLYLVVKGVMELVAYLSAQGYVSTGATPLNLLSIVGLLLVLAFAAKTTVGTNSSTTTKTLSSKLGDESGGVEVHSHVEKMGLVVEVITAKTPRALDAYLKAKQLGGKTADLPSLTSYLEKEYSFVCAWAAPQKQLDARAVRVDFPSPNVYYPLLPTRAYTTDVATAIYVRGTVQPQEGTTLRGLACRYERGVVTDSSSFRPGQPVLRAHSKKKKADDTYRSLIQIVKENLPARSEDAGSESLTRVELSKSPQDWTQDLFLEPGAPTVVRASQVVSELGNWLILLLPAATGLVLASFLPRWVIAADRRHGSDRLWAAGVGAAAGLSVLASAVVFCYWCRRRRTVDEPHSLVFDSALIFVTLLLLPALVSSYSLMVPELHQTAPASPVFWIGLTIMLAFCTFLTVTIVKLLSAATPTGQLVFNAVRVFGSILLLPVLMLSYVLLSSSPAEQVFVAVLVVFLCLCAALTVNIAWPVFTTAPSKAAWFFGFAMVNIAADFLICRAVEGLLILNI